MEPTTTPPKEAATPGGGSGIDLYISVKDKNGQIVHEQCKNGDLYLYNWGAIIASFLKNGFVSSATKNYFIIRRDEIQVAYPGHIHGSMTNYSGSSTYRNAIYQTWSGYGRIVLGGSSLPPSVRDFELGIPIMEIVPLLPAIESEGNTLKVIITGTALFDIQTVIAEAGLSITPPWWGQQQQTTPQNTLITRDIFDPATIPAGGSVTIRFELWFNAMPPAEEV